MEKNNGARSALAVLVAINILNFYDRNALGALTEPIRKEFHLTDTQVGLLGSVFSWLYAVVGVPIGNVADRWSRKKLLTGGIVVWSALTGMASLAGSYAILLFSRLGFAVGEAAVAPTATSWIGDLFPASKRAAPLALFMIGVPMGGALAYFFSGPLAQAFGWRSAMVAAAAPALLLIPLLLRLREPRRGASEIGQEHAEKGFKAIQAVAKVPTLWWIIASGALLNFNMYALGTFMPAFLSRIHHVSLAQSGIDTGITYAIGGIGGSLIAGWMGDRVIRRRTNGRLLWAAGTTVLAAPTGFGPLLTGRVSDMMARRAADAAGSAVLTDAFKAIGLQQAMLIMPVFSVLLGVVLYLGSRTIEGDMRKRAAAAGVVSAVA